MSVSRRVAVAVDGSAGHDAVLRLFAADSPISVGSVLPAQAAHVGDIDDRHIDGLVCVCSVPDANLLNFVRVASETRPWLPIIVACRPDAGAAVREVLDAGAADIVALFDEHEADMAAAQQLSFVLEKVIALRGGTAGGGAASRGEVVTILGPKGGTGKTLTTCNLAVALSQAGRRVAVVDLDLQFGDVGLSLGLDPTRTVYDLAVSGGTIDAEKLDAYLVPHSSGVRALLAPIRPDEAESVTAELVRSILKELQLMCDVVVIDTPPGFTPQVIASIDCSTSLCVVSMLDSLSLKNTRLALDTLELMGYPDEAMQLVLNRADSRVGVQPRDVQALLGRWPDILVPSSRDITRAVNEGHPIVTADPGSDAAKAFHSLAEAYSPSPSGNGGDPASPRAARRKLRAPKFLNFRTAVS